MTEVDKIQEKIERKSRQRTRALRGEDDTPLAELEDDMRRLYDQLRVARAQSRNGHRDGIVRRARIERELEKLMSD